MMKNFLLLASFLVLSVAVVAADKASAHTGGVYLHANGAHGSITVAGPATITLDWGSDNPSDVCTLNGDTASSAPGSRTVTVSANETYTYSCIREGSGTFSASVSINVTYNLSVSVSPSGGGSVGGDVNCSSSCTRTFSAGLTLSLTAAPSADYRFTGWSGACTGTGGCSVTMNSAKSVGATFEAVVPPPLPPETATVNVSATCTTDWTISGGGYTYSSSGARSASHIVAASASGIAYGISTTRAFSTISPSSVVAYPGGVYNVGITCTNDSAASLYTTDGGNLACWSINRDTGNGCPNTSTPVMCAGSNSTGGGCPVPTLSESGTVYGITYSYIDSNKAYPYVEYTLTRGDHVIEGSGTGVTLLPGDLVTFRLSPTSGSGYVPPPRGSLNLHDPTYTCSGINPTVHLKWDAVRRAKAYVIYAGSDTPIYNYPNTSYNDTRVVSRTTKGYTVGAVDNSNTLIALSYHKSIYPDCGTPPPPPSNPTAAAECSATGSLTGIRVNWTVPSGYDSMDADERVWYVPRIKVDSGDYTWIDNPKTAPYLTEHPTKYFIHPLPPVKFGSQYTYIIQPYHSDTVTDYAVDEDGNLYPTETYEDIRELTTIGPSNTVTANCVATILVRAINESGTQVNNFSWTITGATPASSTGVGERSHTITPSSAGTNYTISVTPPAGMTANTFLCPSDAWTPSACPTAGNTLNMLPAQTKGFLIITGGASFDYSLSNSGNIVATRSNVDVQAQNTITKTLTSGSAGPVDLSVSGVPSGVTYTISNRSCTPTCSSIITFTISPSAANGTHNIVVTGTPGNKTTSFNLTINESANMAVTCAADPTVVRLGDLVTLTAAVGGGTAPYTYAWSGTGIPTNPPPATNPYRIRYSTVGNKTANVTVTDNRGRTATCPTPATVRVNFNPNFEEF